MLIEPKIRGFVCVTAHPEGCAANVREQIAYVKKQPALSAAPKKVLVVGSSTGYGLASRIAAAFGGGAATIGVAFERAGEAEKCATAGWYNTAGFEAEAKKAGLFARSFNGDAFGEAMKRQVVETIKADWGTVDCLVYSLASPRRTHPKTGEQFRSVLKTVGKEFKAKNLDTDHAIVNEVTIPPATVDEIRQTVAVMGGEDWEMWVEALADAGVLAKGFKTVAYSYIGPEVTWPIYKDGTIGRAKEDLMRAQAALDKKLASVSGKAWVSVNKAVVTQASSAIPVVPLYISIMQKVMKEKNCHEGTIEQIERLWRQLSDGKPNLDAEGRIRIDNLEMRDDVQAEIKRLWVQVSSENLSGLTDFAGYKKEFLRLFGFGVDGVDYAKETNPVVETSVG